MPVASKTTIRLYPPDIEIIERWAKDNPDLDTGQTLSRPTAIRRMIRSLAHHVAPGATATPDNRPATRRDLVDVASRILERLPATEPAGEHACTNLRLQITE